MDFGEITLDLVCCWGAMRNCSYPGFRNLRRICVLDLVGGSSSR